MKHCVFCDDPATINLNTLRPSCKPCHDFVFSDLDTTSQAFRLGALIGAGVAGEIGNNARAFARRAESRRREFRILNGSV